MLTTLTLPSGGGACTARVAACSSANSYAVLTMLRPLLLAGTVTLAPALQAACTAHGDQDGSSRSQHESSGPWPTYNNAYDGQRFPAAKNITPDNVATLKRVCEARLGDPGASRSGLLVIGDTLYVSTVHTPVVLDPTSCAVRWRHLCEPVQEETPCSKRRRCRTSTSKPTCPGYAMPSD
jgi:glucose dehydrogenase